jgi:hypothetical protein
MKIKVAAALLVAITMFYFSCIDTEERIIVNKDNSGIYLVTLDMGNMLKMVQQMGGNQNDSAKVPEKKDSTMYFKPFVDTSTTLTAEEKQMLRDGSLRLKVDEAANVMKIEIKLPFKNISDLPKLRANYVNAMNKVNMMNKLSSKGDSDSGEAEMPKDMSTANKSLNPAQDAYTFTAAPGKISNKFTNKELFESKISQDSTVQMLQQMSVMMGDMNYKTVFVLPRAVKKYAGNNAEISADKKTVTFHTTLTDLLNRPAAGEYEVEY